MVKGGGGDIALDRNTRKPKHLRKKRNTRQVVGGDITRFDSARKFQERLSRSISEGGRSG